PKPGKKGAVTIPGDAIQVAHAGPVMPMPLPSFRVIESDADLAPANPEIGIGDNDNVDGVTVASLPPAPLERPVELPMPDAVGAVQAFEEDETPDSAI